MLYAAAAGKSILALTDRADIEEIIEDRELPILTENSTTDKAALFEELEGKSERGYTLNHEEPIEWIRALATPAPVKQSNREVVGSINVAEPAHCIQGNKLTKELPETIFGVCNEIDILH